MTCGVVLRAGGRIVESESVSVVCLASDDGWASEKIMQRVWSFSSLLKGKSGINGARGAQEMVELAWLSLLVCTKQNVHPTASLFLGAFV